MGHILKDWSNPNTRPKDNNMKFQSLGITENIFKPGTFQALLHEINAGTKGKDLKKLTPDQLNTVPSIYAGIDPAINIPELENDKVYKTGNGKDILGADIKAITTIIYNKPRSTYCKYEKGGQVRSSVSGGVPLALLGFKRYRNINYDAWRKAALDYVSIEYDDDKDTFTPKLKEGAVEKMFKIDMYLGKTLASTFYDPEEDMIKINPKWGLIMCAALAQELKRWVPTNTDVHYFRDKGMGNYPGSFATVYGTSGINKNKEVSIAMTNLYNTCDTPMRLMLAQRWAWFGNHRSSDMICNHQDWDNMPKAVDAMSQGFVGIKPTDNETKSSLGVFGL